MYEIFEGPIAFKVMGITAEFNKEDIRKRFDAFLNEIEKKKIERLILLGEMCVAHARSIPKEQGFMDQTGNLRSSIGFAVFVDGVAIHSSYGVVKGGELGTKVGMSLAERIAKDVKSTCLIVTAGMNYALHLESKGRDVLASAETLAARELPKMMEELISNVKAV